MDFEKRSKNEQKVKGVNLNFLAIWSQKGSLTLQTRFQRVLSFIEHIHLEKMDFEKSHKNGQNVYSF